MPSSTAKRILLYRFDRQPVEGLVNAASYLLPDKLEWITTAGILQATPYGELKAACFVSETARPDLFTEDTRFERRPKLAGLWARFYFRDGAQLDGILPHNLLEWPNAGFLFVPPRSGAGRGRVFVPRAALLATELRGVMGRTGSAGGKREGAANLSDQQLRIFDP